MPRGWQRCASARPPRVARALSCPPCPRLCPALPVPTVALRSALVGQKRGGGCPAQRFRSQVTMSRPGAAAGPTTCKSSSKVCHRIEKFVMAPWRRPPTPAQALHSRSPRSGLAWSNAARPSVRRSKELVWRFYPLRLPRSSSRTGANFACARLLRTLILAKGAALPRPKTLSR